MVITKKLTIQTQADGQIVDLSGDVTKHVAASGVANGTVTVFVTATTAGVTVLEYEPGLVKDLNAVMERLIPRGDVYHHNVLNNDTNGHSHTRSTLIGPSLVVPVTDRKPYLGQWQKIVLIDFDSRPRSREIVLQIMGE